MNRSESAMKIIAQNKKAFHDYFVEEKYEAGIELFGTEVKSIRQGGVNLKDCYCTITGGEVIVLGMRISPYEKGNIFNKDPLRPKKLLLHKREIMKLLGYIKQDGYALIPLGVCKGKKEYDKRDAIAKRESDIAIRRTLKEFNQK